MSHITLKQLRYFQALAHHGHFGQAAAASAISQPALSVQIKELEHRLGGPLFEREPRRVHLTHLGAELLDRARDILKSVDDLENLARAAQTQLQGRLRIGIIPTIAPYLLPSILTDLTAAYPQADIHIRETMTPTLIQELSDGVIDTAILALPISEPWLSEHPLFEENFVLVRPMAEAGNPVPDPSDLQKMRLLLLEEGHCFRDQALSFCHIPATARAKTLDGTTLSTLVRMVDAGFGVTLIPQMAIASETQSANVSVAHFQDPQPSRAIGMVWRQNSPLTAHFEAMAALIKTATQP
ncbi:hydrogen peroxide-inducible genes activator [uncultured Pelagimonas sp.]|uniref:hydrogen peroxide-inducible genes activator n=1 Tax=uncultured Pelagimonas sp. TaxID=1618102 RepID=UPI00262A6C08|nr:hydrogen peroxide-inducible genes activator [uncultured Pelagimonas sp.]